jgi:hypothetical protein
VKAAIRFVALEAIECFHMFDEIKRQPYRLALHKWNGSFNQSRIGSLGNDIA